MFFDGGDPSVQWIDTKDVDVFPEILSRGELKKIGKKDRYNLFSSKSLISSIGASFTSTGVEIGFFLIVPFLSFTQRLVTSS